MFPEASWGLKWYWKNRGERKHREVTLAEIWGSVPHACCPRSCCCLGRGPGNLSHLPPEVTLGRCCARLWHREDTSPHGMGR